MTTASIVLDIADGLATLTLARPEAGNALDVATCEQLEACAGQIADTPTVRAILLNGMGRNFCVGGDVSTMGALSSEHVDQLTAMVAPLHRALKQLSALDAPLVAAVRGAAAGAGLSLVAAADIVLAAPTAKFVMAYSAIGLSPDGGASWSLPRVIGTRRTLELALTNRRLSTEEAVEWGLVSRIVDDAKLDQEALAQARTLAAGPTLAFGHTRRLISESFAANLSDQLDRELEAIRLTGGSSDARIGIDAFRNRQPALFSGTAEA
jgi:2-(1,2-epoxy-1,2-dihydrophenyl)acetyl-CoA isomerase